MTDEQLAALAAKVDKTDDDGVARKCPSKPDVVAHRIDGCARAPAPEPQGETITLMNDRHDTAIAVRIVLGKPLSTQQVARIRTTLCGRKGCDCRRFSALAMSGPQVSDIKLEMTADGKTVVHIRSKE